MKLCPLLSIVALLLFSGCRQDSISLVKLDLQAQGLPITILAPENPEIQAKDYGIIRDITVKKGEDYFVQIFEYSTTTHDAAGEKLHQLTAVRKTPFFLELIKEDENGFIFSSKQDSIGEGINYDFRIIKILDTKELIFQTGLVGNFSLEQVKTMYNAVK